MDPLVIPSAAIPGPAPVSLTVPEDWIASAAPAVTAIALAPEREGHFRPNVVLTHARMPADADLALLASAGRQVVEALPEFTGGPDQITQHHGRPTVFREFAYRDPQTDLGLYQLQVQTLIPVGHELADLVTMSGTCSGSELDVVPILRAIADSLDSAPSAETVPAS